VFEDTIRESLTVYGPMALGWVFCVLIGIRYISLVDKFVALLERNTQIMTELKTLIQERLKP
jgi:elongation factor P hydroxylase